MVGGGEDSDSDFTTILETLESLWEWFFQMLQFTQTASAAAPRQLPHPLPH